MLDQWSGANQAFSTGKSSSANAARSTLLGLPVEIRTMILRMVVGDQLVYVPRKLHKAVRSPLGFELFALNRQLWAEAFPLFWGTSRICFNRGYKLEKCLDRLTDCQKTNLKHLALHISVTYYRSSRPDDYDMVYRETKREWP